MGPGPAAAAGLLVVGVAATDKDGDVEVLVVGVGEGADWPSPRVGKSVSVGASREDEEVGAEAVDVVGAMTDVAGAMMLDAVERMGKGVAESWSASVNNATDEPARTTRPRRPADTTNARRACGSILDPGVLNTPSKRPALNPPPRTFL